jgi:hypothetical protein
MKTLLYPTSKKNKTYLFLLLLLFISATSIAYGQRINIEKSFASYTQSEILNFESYPGAPNVIYIDAETYFYNPSFDKIALVATFFMVAEDF